MHYEAGSVIKRQLTGWYVAVSWLVGIRWHMGISLGDGSVIHFNGHKKSINARVCREALSDFADGQFVFLHAAPQHDRHAAAICACAAFLCESEENGFNDRYDFARWNCEDFCVACYEAPYEIDWRTCNA